VLVLFIVFTPAFAGCEQKPVAYIGNLGRPAAIQLGLTLAPPKALDDVLDLQKLGFRVLGVLGAG